MPSSPFSAARRRGDRGDGGPEGTRGASLARRSGDPHPIGMHTGEGSLGGDDYLGIDVNRAARIAAVGHGGQVVVSAATAGLVEQTLPDGVVLRDLGLHRLKDFPEPLRLHDLLISGLPSDFAQLRTLDARPTNLPTERTSFVGRTDEVAQLEGMLGEGRFVTLIGPGGAGKTRWRSTWPRGCWIGSPTASSSLT